MESVYSCRVGRWSFPTAEKGTQWGFSQLMGGSSPPTPDIGSPPKGRRNN